MQYDYVIERKDQNEIEEKFNVYLKLYSSWFITLVGKQKDAILCHLILIE